MTNDELKIRHLLQRFMDGETSIGEEKTLEQWFLTHQHVSPDLESYRQMFGWLGSGMPVADGCRQEIEPEALDLRQVDKADTAAPSTHNHRWIAYAAAAVGAVVVAMSFFLLKGRQPAMPPSQGSSTPTLIAKNTDSISNAEVQSDTIFRPQPVKVRKNRKRIHRPYHPIMPVVDRPLTALSDSVLQEADRQADAELARMMAQQQEAFIEMDMAMEQNYALIDMMLDDTAEAPDDEYGNTDNSF